MLWPLLLLSQEPPVAVEADVVYAKVGTRSLQMDVYRPPAVGPAAAIAVFHGGEWIAGTRRDVEWLCRRIAATGMVAAAVEYRLAPQHPWPAMLDDAQTAMRYLRSNGEKHGINTAAIGAAGEGSGGQLALLLGYRHTRDPSPELYAGVSSRAQAVFSIYGLTDLSEGLPESLNPLLTLTLGKPGGEGEAGNWRDASPLAHATREGAPTFLLYGTNDPLVPQSQGRKLQEALKKLAVPVETIYQRDMGHRANPQNKGVMRSVDRALVWIRRQLTGQSPGTATRKGSQPGL